MVWIEERGSLFMVRFADIGGQAKTLSLDAGNAMQADRQFVAPPASFAQDDRHQQPPAREAHTPFANRSAVQTMTIPR